MNFYHSWKEKLYLADFQLIGQNRLKESKYHIGNEDVWKVKTI